MNGNGFRGSHLPASRRVTTLEVVRTTSGATAGGHAAIPRGAPTNETILADYLAVVGPQELNLVVLNGSGRSSTDIALSGLTDLLDLVALRTTHGREPSTFNKELMPGLFMTPTAVQHAVGEWGIQGAVDALAEGLPTLGPRPITPPEEGRASPMMWLVSAGDPRLGEALYAALDRIYRPHRHMWSHAGDEGEDLRWALVVQLLDADLDALFPTLRAQPGWATYLQRSDRYLDRLNPQTGINPR